MRVKEGKVIAALFFVVLTAVGITLGVEQLQGGTASLPFVSKKASAIVRLHDLEGRFFCSGSVIGKHRILTAAHCVLPPDILLALGAKPAEVSIRNEHGWHVGFAKVIAGSNFTDVALLETPTFLDDQFEIMPVVTDATEAIKLLKSSAKKTTCGYPYGGKLYCNEFKYESRYYFFFAGDGFGYPGMSGGPTIVDGKIIAVSSAATQTQFLIAPTLSMYDYFGVSAAE